MSEPPFPESLEPRFQTPARWQWGEFERLEGRRIRYGHCKPEGRKKPKGILVYLPGMGEPAEKFFETAKEFLDQNFVVYVMDWYGQGGSGRYLSNSNKRHAIAFEEDLKDLHHFIINHIDTSDRKSKKEDLEHIIDQINHDELESVGIPMIMLAHSMGGHLGLRFLHDYPGLFHCAILSAPMVGIFATRYLHPPFDQIVSGWLDSMMSESYALGDKDWNYERREKTKFILTSDPVRGSVQNEWFRISPTLQIGNVTYGWVHEAIKSCSKLQRKAPSVETPCFIAIAGKDVLVDNHITCITASLMPDAKTLELPEAKHEILMESDQHRSKFMAELFKFIDARIS